MSEKVGYKIISKGTEKKWTEQGNAVRKLAVQKTHLSFVLSLAGVRHSGFCPAVFRWHMGKHVSCKAGFKQIGRFPKRTQWLIKDLTVERRHIGNVCSDSRWSEFADSVWVNGLLTEKTGNSGWESSRWDKIPSSAVFTHDREVEAEWARGWDLWKLRC